MREFKVGDRIKITENIPHFKDETGVVQAITPYGWNPVKRHVIVKMDDTPRLPETLRLWDNQMELVLNGLQKLSKLLK